MNTVGRDDRAATAGSLGRDTGLVVNSGDYTVTVAGATGKTGRLILAATARAGWRVRAATRRPVEHPGWVRLDWDDPSTWTTAFEGSDAAYLLIPFNHPGAPEKTPDLMAAAAEVGVRRIVFLSTLDAEHAAPDNSSVVTEESLRRLPVAWTILRPTWFLDNFTTGSFQAMTAAGELRLPAGDGRIPFVDVRDIADLATASLSPDGPEGILPVTGPAAVGHHEVAEVFSEVSGRDIRYLPVSVDEFVELMQSRGFPRSYGLFLGAALNDVATGRLAVPVHQTVANVLGRSAYSVRDFAMHHVDRLRSSRVRQT